MVCPARGGSVESAPPGSQGCWPTKQALAHSSCRLPSGLRARYPDCSLRRALSYCSNHKLCSHPLWPAQRGLSELSGQPLTLGVFRFCQIYRDITSPPSQIPSPRPSGSPVLPKSLMLTLLLLMVLLSFTPVGRASGFHSHHHIDDQSPRALP